MSRKVYYRSKINLLRLFIRALIPSTPHLLILILYLFLTLIMTWPLALNLTTAIPGDSFDGWQNYWNQWWIKVALIEQIRNPFTTDLLYYPTGVGLYFHTLNPFNGLTTLPIQLSAGLIPAYNAVVFLSWVLGGYGTYLLTRFVFTRQQPVRHATSNQHEPSRFAHVGAFIAGVIFTFAPFHMAHLLGHMQVMSLQWIPFYILYSIRATDHSSQGKPWLHDAGMAGLFLILTGLCDWYFVLYLFLFTGLLIGWRGIQQLAQWDSGMTALRLLAMPLPAIIAGLLFLLILSPLLVPMVREATQFSFMVRPTSDLYILSASLADFFVPNRLHTLFRPQSFEWIGNQIAPVSERTISLGYLPLALTLIAIVKDHKRVLFWLTSALFFLFMALGPQIHIGNISWETLPTDAAKQMSWTPFGILNQTIPFMRISRSVSRYALMVQLSIAVMAGVGLFSLYRQAKSSWVRPPSLYIGSFLCLTLILFEFWVAPYPLSPPDTPDFYQTLKSSQSDKSILNLPMNYDRPGYLLYQTVHQQPLAVAYISRDDPRTLTERTPVLQHLRHLGPDIIEVDPAQVGMTVLNDLEVGTVILDRYKMPGGEERAYTTALAQAIFEGHSPIYEDDRLTAYQVAPINKAEPYLILGPLNWGPLEEDDQGIMSRALLGSSAEIQHYHVPPGAKLRIRYHTVPSSEIQLDLAANLIGQVTLPAAPNGNEFLVSLAEGSGTTRLLAEPSLQIFIEKLELVTD